MNETKQTYHTHLLIPQLIENIAEQSSDALSKYFYKQRKSQLKEKYSVCYITSHSDANNYAKAPSFHTIPLPSCSKSLQIH